MKTLMLITVLMIIGSPIAKADCGDSEIEVLNIHIEGVK